MSKENEPTPESVTKERDELAKRRGRRKAQKIDDSPQVDTLKGLKAV